VPQLLNNRASIEKKIRKEKHLFCEYDEKKIENECLLGRKIVKNKIEL
jgi:hypothetical protein